MELEKIALGGLGAFTQTECGFRIGQYHLDEPWPYIYTSRKILLRVDQRGPDYVQFQPPSGTLLYKRERFQPYPSCLIWLKLSEDRAFSSFYLPAVGGVEPEAFSCEYRPEKAVYKVTLDSIECETELMVPQDDAVVVMTCTVTNRESPSREIELLPVLRPHMAACSLAPWDVPSLYQKIGYSSSPYPAFLIELRNPAGVPSLREYAFVITDLQPPDEVEVDYASFVGRGTFDNPEALHGKPMSVTGDNQFDYDSYTASNSVDGRQGVVALRKRLMLGPGQSFRFTAVMGTVDAQGKGVQPSFEQIDTFSRYFDPKVRRREMDGVRLSISSFSAKRGIVTPDKVFDRYVTEYLPLQLKWVRTLDRGWPTGMRGVRDCAQDTTALVPLDPPAARKTLLELFEVQRSDGWFPRQYSIRGRDGTHDLRGYVDGGVWVWELLYQYLCHTKDFGLLAEKIPFLDEDREASILGHLLLLESYYLAEKNTGEHGLCLIREGDWNDSINRAGLEGRGESVMVSCQVVMMLKELAALLGHLSRHRDPQLGLSGDDLLRLAEDYTDRSDRLKADILTHALNSEGYLNGVFTDNGEWVFSPHDPDGQRRTNIPVNAFGIISGVLSGDAAVRAIGILETMKQTDGWPLFRPGIGDPPIRNLGRVGQGDLAVGLGENGTPYNHGSHGFLGRAAACLGKGDLLYEVLRYMLPYDQRCHPVRRSKTAPYAVVNHWKTAPGQEGRGGDCFLSGSISTALRNVYNGMFGIRPRLDGLALAPALPHDWPQAKVRFSYLGADVRVTYTRHVHKTDPPHLRVNGEETFVMRKSVVLDRKWPVVPDRVFAAGGRCDIVW